MSDLWTAMGASEDPRDDFQMAIRVFAQRSGIRPGTEEEEFVSHVMYQAGFRMGEIVKNRKATQVLTRPYQHAHDTFIFECFGTGDKDIDEEFRLRDEAGMGFSVRYRKWKEQKGIIPNFNR